MNELAHPDEALQSADETGTNEPTVKPGSLKEKVLKPRSIVSFALAIGFFVFFLFRTDIDLEQTWQNIRNANLWFISAAAAVHFCAFGVRGYRWHILLEHGSRSSSTEVSIPGTRNLTSIIVISWFANCLVPAKLGDLYRTYLLKRDSGTDYSAGFASVIAERFYDLIVLFTMMTAGALIAFRGHIPDAAVTALAVGVALLGVVFLGSTILWLTRDRLRQRVPERYRSHLLIFSDVFVACLKNPAVPLLLTVVIWSMDGLRLLLVARSVDVQLPVSTALFVALMSALLTTIPFTPAGLGVVEVAMISVLKIVDVPAELASSIAIIDRLITYWGVIAAGLLLYLLRYRGREVDTATWKAEPESSST